MRFSAQGARMPHDVIPPDSGLPFDAAAMPETVVLTADRARLRLTWPGGETAEVDAPKLRGACRCAWCTRARVDGIFAASFEAVTIERVVPIGDYAINIAFSDGHARGIFPWTFLRKLALPDGAVSTTQPMRATAPQRHDGVSA
jgi:prepilin-type processing-associated H-X9-DG protein